MKSRRLIRGERHSVTSGHRLRVRQSERLKSQSERLKKLREKVIASKDDLAASDKKAEFEHSDSEFEHDECNPCTDGCIACDVAFWYYSEDEVAYKRSLGLVCDEQGHWYDPCRCTVFTQPTGVVFEDDKESQQQDNGPPE